MEEFVNEDFIPGRVMECSIGVSSPRMEMDGGLRWEGRSYFINTLDTAVTLAPRVSSHSR